MPQTCSFIYSEGRKKFVSRFTIRPIDTVMSFNTKIARSFWHQVYVSFNALKGRARRLSPLTIADVRNVIHIVYHESLHIIVKLLIKADTPYKFYTYDVPPSLHTASTKRVNATLSL